MEARTPRQDRANALLENIKPELLKLLSGAPAHGLVGVELVIHNGEIKRIVSKMEVSRLPPRTGVSL